MDRIEYIVVNQTGQFYTENCCKVKGTYPFLWTPYRHQAKRYQSKGGHSKWRTGVVGRCKHT